MSFSQGTEDTLPALVAGCALLDRDSQKKLYAHFYGYAFSICHRFVSKEEETLEVVNDGYHSKGVGENDLFIIATTRAHGAELISEEGRQIKPPDIPSKRKIPSVCSLPEVSVSCINFIELIKRSDQVF